MAFQRKTWNFQRPHVDRFVATRDSLTELRRRRSVGECRSDDAKEIWCGKYLRQKRHALHLNEAFGLESQPAQNVQFDYLPRKETVQIWPCAPRKKKYLSSADSILDLPTYRQSIFPDVVDWSNSDMLVAALGNKYYSFSWRTQSRISQGLTQGDIYCCKFDPRGKMLTLGGCQTVEIHDCALSKRTGFSYCRCPRDDECYISSIDWSPTGNSFVTGCTHGMLVSFDRDNRHINWRRLGPCIVLVRISPDARYVAVATFTQIVIFTWPGLEEYMDFSFQENVKALSWHPWRSALLAMALSGTNTVPRVVLWDTPPGLVQGRIQFTPSHYVIDTMLFSNKTGELALSLFDTDSSAILRKNGSQLVVMSEADTVVDQWGEGRDGLDRIRTMIFSPDGTKLATATVDEDLIIWNFFPEDDKNCKRSKSRRFSAIPVYLDEVTNGISIR